MLFKKEKNTEMVKFHIGFIIKIVIYCVCIPIPFFVLLYKNEIFVIFCECVNFLFI